MSVVYASPNRLSKVKFRACLDVWDEHQTSRIRGRISFIVVLAVPLQRYKVAFSFFLLSSKQAEGLLAEIEDWILYCRCCSSLVSMRRAAWTTGRPCGILRGIIT